MSEITPVEDCPPILLCDICQCIRSTTQSQYTEKQIQTEPIKENYRIYRYVPFLSVAIISFATGFWIGKYHKKTN
jgi:hypothetical protein